MANELSDKQKAFIEFLLRDPNMRPGPAAEKAGYAPKSAARMGNRLLKNPTVAKIVQKKMDERAHQLELTPEAVLEEIAAHAKSDIRLLFTSKGDLKQLNDLPAEIARSVQSIKFTTRGCINEDGTRGVEYVCEVRLVDKLKAAELLGRNLTLFTEKVHVEVAGLAKTLDKAKQRADKAHQRVKPKLSIVDNDERKVG